MKQRKTKNVAFIVAPLIATLVVAVTTVASGPVGDPVSDTTAATIRGGAECETMTRKSCPGGTSDECPDFELYVKQGDCADTQCYHGSGAGVCLDENGACDWVNWDETGVGCS